MGQIVWDFTPVEPLRALISCPAPAIWQKRQFFLNVLGFAPII